MKRILLAMAAAGALGAAEPNEMLRSYLTGIAKKQISSHREAVAELRSPQQIQEAGQRARQLLKTMIGGLPTERTPLNLQRTGTIDRGDYRIEKIVFESSPRFYVTANLYVPQTGSGPFPAVLHPTGHSTAAKARAFYQTLSLGLVKQGFIVLTYDPLGQGERRLFYDSDLADSKVGGTTVEHDMVGMQSLLAGESIARYMIWDGIRALDLLASLPQVDARRLAVAGCSGGGTMTAYIAALDDRIQAAASACYITDWEDQLQGTGPQDAEQEFPDQLKLGFNHIDFILAFAPKPYLVCNTEQDFFPLSGARRTVDEAKRLYSALGVPDRIGWAVGPGGHGMPPVVREAVYGWMKHWLKDGPSGPAAEPKFQTEFEQDLYVTNTGQVSTSLGGETASSENSRRYSTLVPPRQTPRSMADLDGVRRVLVEKIASVTRFERQAGKISYRKEPPQVRDGYTLTPMWLDLAEGRQLFAELLEPEAAHTRRKTILYLDEAGATAAARENGSGAALARLGYRVFALDLSGMGATTSRWGGYASAWFGQEKTAWLALMVGRPLVGIRMDDIGRGLDALAESDLLFDNRAMAFASGAAAVPLLHRAVLDTRLSHLLVEGGLISYAAMSAAPVHRQMFEAVVPNVLGSYDLPDLVAALAPRPVSLIDLRTPAGSVAPLPAVRSAYQFGVEAYHAAGADTALRFGLRREGEALEQTYPELTAPSH